MNHPFYFRNIKKFELSKPKLISTTDSFNKRFNNE